MKPNIRPEMKSSFARTQQFNAQQKNPFMQLFFFVPKTYYVLSKMRKLYRYYCTVSEP